MADANRNVSVDITGDSSDLENAFDKASRSSDNFDKEQEKNAENDKSRWKSWGDSVKDTFNSAWDGIKSFGDKLSGSKFGLDFDESNKKLNNFKDNLVGLFDKIATGAEKAFGGLGKSLEDLDGRTKLILAGVAAGLVALGPAAGIASGAVVFVLGAAFAAMGIMAASHASDIRGEFGAAWDAIKDGFRDSASAFEEPLRHIPGVMRDVFSTFKPELDQAFATIAPAFDGLVKSWGEGFKQLAPALVPLSEGLSSVFDRLSERAPAILGALGGAIETFGNSAVKYGDDFAAAVEFVFKTVDAIANSLDWMSGQWHEGLANLDSLINILSWSDWQSDMAGTNVQFAQIRDNIDRAADAIGKITERFDNATISADALKLELDQLNGVHITADRLAIGVGQAISKLDEAIFKYGASLDVTTKAGSLEALAMMDQAQKSNDLLVARADEGAKVKELNGVYEANRFQLIQTAEKIGYTKEQAEKLADRYLSMPKSINTKITADTSSAQGAVDAFITFNSGRTIPIAVLEKNSQMRDGGMVGYASGGFVSGPGSSRSDSIPIRASRGEYIVNAASARRFLPELEAINSGRGGGMGGTTVVYQINTTVGPTANLSAVGSEIVKAIQAHEQRSSKSWRSN